MYSWDYFVTEEGIALIRVIYRWRLAFEVVPIIGFELMTYRLQGGCSTN